MPFRLILIIVIPLLIIVAILSIIFSEVLWEFLLLGLVFTKHIGTKILIAIKKFFFKKGVVSYATIAWKHVLLTSGLALGKRAIINSITGFFHTHIIEPLIHPITRYLKIRWRLFKTSNFLKKISVLIFTSIPATLALWLIGIIDAVLLLMQSFSLAKFLTMILKLIAVLLLFFQGIWRTWVQPYLDFIVAALIIGFIERIPFIGTVLRRMRILLKWHWRKVKVKKRKVVEEHIAVNVTKVGEKIHAHVNEQKKVVEARMKVLEKKKDKEEKKDNKNKP